MKIIIAASAFTLVACTSPSDNAPSSQNQPSEAAVMPQNAVEPTSPQLNQAKPADTAPAKAASGTCNAAVGQYAVGKKFSDALAATLKKETGAANVRTIAPGTMVTMDYRDDRLNISYDEKGVITKVDCG